MASEIRIQLCGRLAVTVEGARVEHRFPGRQGRLLFAHLVLTRRRPVSRGELLDAIWADALPAAPEVALRALLSKLRRALGSELLTTGSEVHLTLPDGAFVDLEAAREALHRAQSAVARGNFVAAWAPARVALHTADRGFLPGETASWTEEVRRELADLRVAALEAVAATGIGIGGEELPATERAARRLVELEPLRESGWLWLMRAHAARGNVSSALVTYERVRALLRDELGTAPGAHLQELHARLLRT